MDSRLQRFASPSSVPYAVPAAVGGWLAASLPRGRSIVLEGAGHAPFWDDPAGFNRALRDFIQEGA